MTPLHEAPGAFPLRPVLRAADRAGLGIACYLAAVVGVAARMYVEGTYPVGGVVAVEAALRPVAVLFWFLYFACRMVLVRRGAFREATVAVVEWLSWRLTGKSPGGHGERLGRWLRRHPVVEGVLVLCAVGAVVALFAVGPGDVPRAPPPLPL